MPQNTVEEINDYEQSLKISRDLKGVIGTAYEKGKLEVARNLKSLGVDIDIIIKSTGLSLDDIANL